ncbi:hypothetical protein Tco_1078667 [Tanacetum coccineum]|uniref:Uncharacterized protein n=1 Tax=Tanacetum coccineum TaxID=301880 RepID=A0ABQ5HPN0_9ASTR
MIMHSDRKPPLALRYLFRLRTRRPQIEPGPEDERAGQKSIVYLDAVFGFDFVTCPLPWLFKLSQFLRIHQRIVILFDYTPASLDYSLASETESDPSKDPSSDHIPPLPAISPFLSLVDDTTDSDTSDTPPSPTHGTPFTEITSSTQRSPIIPRRRVMILAPRQPIPHGRPYCYHLNGPIHMITARKRVGPLPIQQLNFYLPSSRTV